jgi:hypothetical protein
MLYVGENVTFNVFPLFFERQIYLGQIYVYKNYQITDTPPFFRLDSFSN